MLLIFCIAPLFGQENRKGITIAWESIPATYHVEIRTAGQVFYTVDTELNEIELNLAPGVYEYQIGFIDPFGNIMSKTSWTKLEILYDSFPYFRLTEPVTAWLSDDTISLEIESSLLNPNTEFLLIQNDKEIPITGVQKDKTLKFTVDTTVLSLGAWTLLSVNPTGKSFQIDAALTILGKQDFRLEPMQPQEITNRGPTPLEIKGFHFDDAMKVSIQGSSGVIPVENISVKNSREAWITMDTKKTKPGSYSLIITNTSGEVSSQENAIILRKPGSGNKSGGIEGGVLQQRLRIQSGYTPMITIYNRGSITKVNPSFLGMDFAVYLNSGNKAPFLSSLGVGFQGTFTINGPNQVYGPYDMTGMVNILTYWQPLSKGSISPVIELGIGNMWRNFFTDPSSQNQLFFRMGVALDFLKNPVFHQVGLSVILSFNDTGMIPTIGLMFRRGLRF